MVGNSEYGMGDGTLCAVILMMAFLILWRDEIKEEELLAKLAILNPEQPKERIMSEKKISTKEQESKESDREEEIVECVEAEDV